MSCDLAGQALLAADLERKPRDTFRDELLVNVRANRYHDFKSDVAMPKVALVQDLLRYGYRDLAHKAMRGEYDDTPDEKDIEHLEKLAADSPLAEMFRRFNVRRDS